MKDKLTGLFDHRLELVPGELFTCSGETAMDKLDKMLGRIKPERFEEVRTLLTLNRHFGGRCRIVHSDDYTEEDAGWEPWVYSSNNGKMCQGSYCGVDHWITVPIDRHTSWKTIEDTVRHELIHLLQDIVSVRDRHDERFESALGLLTKHVKWGEGLADCFIRTFEEQDASPGDEDFMPLSEIEAHSIDGWKKSCTDWANEVKRSFEATHWMNWYCPL